MWVKICGINDVATAEAVSALRPDAIGLNFYAKSKRCVARDVAREIVSRLPRSVTPVGLFVNHSHAEIRDIATECGLKVIQLHGDESPEFAAELREFSIIRAIRVEQDRLDQVAQELAAYAAFKANLFGCLVDAHVPGSYGGTGQLAPWQLLANGWNPGWPPLILAGGLHPGNVAAAVAAVKPWGVDVASGVESSPGRQDVDAVMRFISAARHGPASA